jgi:myo-inositol 2-dehydrogenase/D-chiro-inositol 1-dehydrogenase
MTAHLFSACSTGRIRLGIIGCGAIARAQHIPAIRAAGAIDLAAIADPSRDSAADGAAVWLGIPYDRTGGAHRSYPDVRRFLADSWRPDHAALLAVGGIDAVLIATPNNTHEAIARECLAAGVHVFCEKPVAFTAEAHDDLDRMANERGLVFQVGLVLRYSAVFRHVRRLVQQSSAPLMMLVNEFRPFPHMEWRFSKSISGGVFIEKNCHHFDLFNWMLGDAVPPLRVVAFGGQAVLKDEPRECWCLYEKKGLPASEVPDHAWVLVEYANGVRAQLGLSFFCPWGREFRMSLLSEDSKIDVYELDRLIYVHRAPAKAQRFPPDPTGRTWQDEAGYQEEGAVHSGAVQQWVEFAGCIRTGDRPWCDLTRARESIRLAVAAQRSLDEGCIVTLVGRLPKPGSDE